MKLENLLKRREVETPLEILPSDVRYALQYKGGVLNKTELDALIQNNFTNEALYLVFKSLVDAPNEHKKLLEEYIAGAINKDAAVDKNFVRELVAPALSNKENITVQGKKLTQISRQGFDLWQEKFSSLAEKLSSDERDVYLIAHSTFIGMDAFLKFFSKKNKNLNILIPEWIGNENIGYVVNFVDELANVTWLRLPFENKKDLILVEDTKNTGKTLQKIQDFLMENGCQELETIVLDKTL